MEVTFNEKGSLLDYIGLELLGKTAGVLRNAAVGDFVRLVDMIENAPRIFIIGAGRSGLVGRLFAMRLMHLGGVVYVVGDTTTPATARDDVLFAISGSGKTQSVVNVARQAREAGARVVCVGLDVGALTPLEELADLAIRLDRRTNNHLRLVYPPRAEGHPRASITPMGTVFEMATLVYLESLIAELIHRRHIPESEMKMRHANLE